MCGIFGYITTEAEKKQVDLKKITRRLFLATQTRGKDATGFATLIGDKLFYFKDKGSASEFVSKGKFDKVITLGNVFIGHCRAGTHGSPDNNINNHPFLSEVLSGALVHNGVISNDKAVISQLSLKMEGECDSEVILRCMETNKNLNVMQNIKKSIEKLRGSCTIAYLTKKHKDELFLTRISNPLFLAYVPVLKTIFFASTEGILKYGFSKSSRYFNFFDKCVSEYEFIVKELEDDTAYRIKTSNGGFNISQIGCETKGEYLTINEKSYWHRDSNEIKRIPYTGLSKEASDEMFDSFIDDNGQVRGFGR